MHVAFQLPYVYDYVTKLCRRQVEMIHNHEHEMYAILDKVKPHTENIRGLNFASVTCTTVQVS
jgi:hypothetical protein